MRKLLFIFIILLYTCIPLSILIFNNLYEYKFYILTFFSILIYIIFRLSKISNDDLGFNKNVINSVKRNIPLIILFILIIIIFRLLNLNKYKPTEGILFYLFYVFFSCPAQEFLYRGVFLYFEKNLIKNKYIILITSSLCYSFVHIIYKDYLTCVLTFIIGIIWYILYRKDNNLAGVSLSHIVLGILTISLGIIN